MNKQISILFFVIHVMTFNFFFAQESEKEKKQPVEDLLFTEHSLLPIRLSYSNKELKKDTNDSTYIETNIAYNINETWENVEVDIRARGNFRLENCHFVPVKIKLKKKKVKGTIFQGHKNLKLVLPCLVQKDNNDNVIKEYLAYRIFEIVSPYYFRTRLLNIEFEEQRNGKVKTQQLKGFFIEDDKHVAKRLEGKVFDRKVHPMAQDDLASVRNAMFQCLISNVDFSQAEQHNIKLIFINNHMIPVPYDFDMSGLVNASYATVSYLGTKTKPQTSVTDRRYRGFKRDYSYYKEVRQEFMTHKTDIYNVFAEAETLFENPKEYKKALEYVDSFYKILENDKAFQEHIVDKARTE